MRQILLPILISLVFSSLSAQVGNIPILSDVLTLQVIPIEKPEIGSPMLVGQSGYVDGNLHIMDFRNYNLWKVSDDGHLNFVKRIVPSDSLRLSSGAHVGSDIKFFGADGLVKDGNMRTVLKPKTKFKQFPAATDFTFLRWQYVPDDRTYVTGLEMNWPGWNKTRKIEDYYHKAKSLAVYDEKGNRTALLAPYPEVFSEVKYMTYMDEPWFFVDSEKDFIHVGHESESTIHTYDYQGNCLASSETFSDGFPDSAYGQVKSELDSRLYKVKYRIESPNYGRIIYDKENDVLLRFYCTAETDTTTVSPAYVHQLSEWVKDKSKSCIGPHRAESIQLKQMFNKPVYLLIYKSGKLIGMTPSPFKFFDHYAGLSTDGFHTIQSSGPNGWVFYKFKIRLPSE